MYFGKSFRLALSNWKVLLKSLLIQLATLVMFLAVAVLSFDDLVKEIVVAFQSTGVGDLIGDMITRLFNNTFDTAHFTEHLAEVIEQIKNAFAQVNNVWGRLEVSVLICIFAFVVYRVLISFTDVAVGYQLNEFMDSNAERPFVWYLFKKMGKALCFVFRQLVLALVFDSLIIAGSLAIGIGAMVLFGWWAIIPTVVVGVVLYALRLTFMAYCLPSVVYQDEKKVRVAFRDGIANVLYSFGRVFAHVIIVVVVMVVTSSVAYIFNENRWIALSISAVVNFLLFFIIKCVSFVLYYQTNNYPYFYKSICLEGTEKYNRKHKIKNK